MRAPCTGGRTATGPTTVPTATARHRSARGIHLLAILLLPVALCATLAGAPQATAATTSFVPDLVMTPIVPAYVSGAESGAEVTLDVDGSSATKVATDGSALVEVAGLAQGLHSWSLSIADANVTTTTKGFVLVDLEVSDLHASLQLSQDRGDQALANLTKSLKAFEARVEARQNQTLAKLTAQVAALPPRVAQNVTRAAAANASVSGHRLNATQAAANATDPLLRQGMQQAVAAAGQAQAAALGARGVGYAAVAGAALLAVTLLPLNGFLFLQARRSRREALVLLLVLAARAGVTPDSPELQKAMEAFDGKGPKGPGGEGKDPAAAGTGPSDKAIAAAVAGSHT